MLIFLGNLFSHAVFYAVLLYFFQNREKGKAISLGIYLLGSAVWFGGFDFSLLTYGVWTFLYAEFLPFILPPLVHLVYGTAHGWRLRKFSETDPRWKIRKSPRTTLAFPRAEIVPLWILLSASGIGLAVMLALFPLEGNYLVLSGSLLVSAGFSGFRLWDLSRFRSQKIIVICGKKDFLIYEKSVGPETRTVDYETLLNGESSFVDYVGRAIVLDQDKGAREFHQVFRTADSKYRNSALVSGDEIYYREIAGRFLHLYEARMRIVIRGGRVLAFRKNKK